MNELQTYGHCIRHLLQQRNCKAEELVSQINARGTVRTTKANLSRIMTGKRLPPEAEAEVIAVVLNEPLLCKAYQLLSAAHSTNDSPFILAFHEIIDQILQAESDEGVVVSGKKEIDYGLLYRMIKNLYEHSKENEVIDYIKDNFPLKLASINGLGEMIRRLKSMYQCLLYGEHVSLKEKAWLAAALLYFIAPIDLIPDYVIPSGFVDDSIVIGFIVRKFDTMLTQFDPMRS